MIENFDFGIVIGSLPFLLKGLNCSFYLNLLALIGWIFFGTIMALMRVSKFKTLQYFSMTYVNFLRSFNETHSSTLCIVLFTKPNSRQGDIFLINRASEVPPVVENLGVIFVIFLILQ